MKVALISLAMAFAMLIPELEKTSEGDIREVEVKPECEEPVVTIPLKRAGRLLIIEAEVDSIRGNFIFDTGAPYLVLNKTYFRGYKKRKRGTASGIAGSEAIRSINVGHLSFRGISYHDLNADLANLGAIENVRGIKILGLLGFSLFKEFEMEIDVRNGVLKLYKTDSEGETLSPVPSAVCEIK
ncbi:MAG: retropepsin-like aspartic protease, partial [Bacteroidota bacterium]